MAISIECDIVIYLRLEFKVLLVINLYRTHNHLQSLFTT